MQRDVPHYNGGVAQRLLHSHMFEHGRSTEGFDRELTVQRVAVAGPLRAGNRATERAGKKRPSRRSG